MSAQPKSIDVPRFVGWILGGLVVGVLVATVIGFMIPIRFESRAIVASAERTEGEIHLSLTQAKLIEREYELKQLGDDSETISRNTRLRRTPAGIEILVTSSNKENARNIALEGARRFRSLRHERGLAGRTVEVRAFDSMDPELLKDAVVLRRLLAEQARAAGFGNFLEISSKVTAGNASAKALAESEDFNRRFARYEEISVQFGLDGVPGEPLAAPLELLEAPETAKRSVVGPARIIGFLGKTGGIGLGIVAAFLFGWKPCAEGLMKVKVPAVNSPDEW